jgi:transposase
MAVVDDNGTPLGIMIESANVSEIRLAGPVLATIKVPRRKGKPKTRPKELVGDKGYDSRAFRRELRGRGIKPCIPYRDFGHARKGRKPDLSDYKERWHVERSFAWIQDFRRLLTRFDRLKMMYLAFLYLAAILICIRPLVSGYPLVFSV